MVSLHIYKDLEQREEWRAVPGHSGYEVSSLGRVRSYRAHGGKRRLAVPRLRTIRVGVNGYVQVGLQVASGQQKQFSVHSLVAAAFLGPRPEGHHVAHFDGDRANNHVSNLRYATPHENAQDKERHGTVLRGEDGANTKLTAQQVEEIRLRYLNGELQAPLALAFGISQSQVSNIVRHASWSHMDLEGEAC